MTDGRRFDPLGWFMSTAFSLLVGVVALVVAVHLLQTIWVWLIGTAAVSSVIALLAIAVTIWHRRQPW